MVPPHAAASPIAHSGRLLKRELEARGLSTNRLALDLGVPSGRITDVLRGRRSISAGIAVRLGRYFHNSPLFWLNLQNQHDVGLVERELGEEISQRVRPRPKRPGAECARQAAVSAGPLRYLRSFQAGLKDLARCHS